MSVGEVRQQIASALRASREGRQRTYSEVQKIDSAVGRLMAISERLGAAATALKEVEALLNEAKGSLLKKGMPKVYEAFGALSIAKQDSNDPNAQSAVKYHGMATGKIDLGIRTTDEVSTTVETIRNTVSQQQELAAKAAVLLVGTENLGAIRPLSSAVAACQEGANAAQRWDATLASGFDQA